MYQGLGQMLTKRLRHHQGCSETPKCAYVIYGQILAPKSLQRIFKYLSTFQLQWRGEGHDHDGAVPPAVLAAHRWRGQVPHQDRRWSRQEGPLQPLHLSTQLATLTAICLNQTVPAAGIISMIKIDNKCMIFCCFKTIAFSFPRVQKNISYIYVLCRTLGQYVI